MSDSNSRFWGVVGALAGVAGVLLTYVIWQDSLESEDDPSDTPSEVETGEGAGNDSDNDGGENNGNDGGDGDEETTADGGRWEQYDSFDIDLFATGDYTDCWDQQFDLDAGGYSETAPNSGPYAGWADLSWNSCAGGYAGYLDGMYGSSATAGSGVGDDPASCAEAIVDDSQFNYLINPDDPEWIGGCVRTDLELFATVQLNSLYWNGDFAEASIHVALWEWVE